MHILISPQSLIVPLFRHLPRTVVSSGTHHRQQTASGGGAVPAIVTPFDQSSRPEKKKT